MVANDVRVANLPDRVSPHLLEIGEIELDLSLWRLLRGGIQIDALHLWGYGDLLSGQ